MIGKKQFQTTLLLLEWTHAFPKNWIPHFRILMWAFDWHWMESTLTRISFVLFSKSVCAPMSLWISWFVPQACLRHLKQSATHLAFTSLLSFSNSPSKIERISVKAWRKTPPGTDLKRKLSVKGNFKIT